MQNVSSLANGFVSSSLKDPRLAGLTAGKSNNSAATSDKVSSQLCAMLGGGCKAPLSESQVASAATSLNSIESNSKVRDVVMASVGDKLPGVLTGLL